MSGVLVGGLTALRVGESTTISASVVAQDCSSGQLVLQWSSSAPAIATVNAAGVVTGAAPGRATIRAAAGGAAGEVEVVVEAPVAAVDVSPSVATLVQGRVTAADGDAPGCAGEPADRAGGELAIGVTA